MTTASAHPALRGRPVYLDHNATTPIDPAVVEAMTPYLTREFGNPSSSHTYGAAAHVGLEEARRQVAGLVCAPAGAVVFTGSGTEADALAIRGAVLAAPPGRRRHVITQGTEHPAVLAACRELEDLHGVDVTYLGVDQNGQVDAAEVAAAITAHTVLVSVMHANNETGTIQPIARIARATRSAGVLLHVDAAQSAGKIDIDVDALGVDLLTVVGHKLYAPKGIGALYIRPGVTLHPLIGGGGQERGLRAGTENVAYAVGFGEAAALAARSLAGGETQRLRGLRDRFERRMETLLPGRVHLNGHPTQRLPNTANVRIDRAPALALLANLTDVVVSAGSACHAGRDEPSPVLTAMGLSATQALAAIRVSLGRWTSPDEVDDASAHIAHAARARST
ncbi:cysteine desulfurase family protein [Fodinibacter luteus]|uniref:Cysteine desulfurase family protein n=1 Tax=Fodinibacter luteus TaxID=552064 RepID=A0ABP8KN97_9MICO